MRNLDCGPSLRPHDADNARRSSASVGDRAVNPPSIADALGTCAALCSMASFVPQIIKIRRERDASSVSLRMYAVTVTGFTLWILYGLLIASWPVIGANAVCLALSATVLALKWRYDHTRVRRASA
jgi:MtN3 and saliva related transmembrane protein